MWWAPIGLIIKTTFLNAALATVFSASAIAFFSGTGLEETRETAGGWPRPWAIPNLPELTRAVILLCPITAVAYGSYGLASGFGVGVLLWTRRRTVRSAWQLLGDVTIVGFLWGVSFMLFDGFMNPYSSPASHLLAMTAGVPCAPICALAFRKRIGALRNQLEAATIDG